MTISIDPYDVWLSLLGAWQVVALTCGVMYIRGIHVWRRQVYWVGVALLLLAGGAALLSGQVMQVALTIGFGMPYLLLMIPWAKVRAGVHHSFLRARVWLDS